MEAQEIRQWRPAALPVTDIPEFQDAAERMIRLRDSIFRRTLDDSDGCNRHPAQNYKRLRAIFDKTIKWSM
jgi:hypothetical protein